MHYLIVGIAIFLLIAGCIFAGVCIYNYNYEVSVKKRRDVSLNTRMSVMSNLVDIVFTAARESNTKPFLLYGTLLGHIRQNDFICYDFDVDLGIMTDEYNLLYSKLLTTVSQYKDFIVKKKEWFGYRQIVVVHTPTQINADISEFIQTKKGLVRNVPWFYTKFFLKECRTYYPNEWLLPLKEVKFNNSMVYIPSHSEKLLECYYGNNYLTPDHYCDSECNCIKK